MNYCVILVVLGLFAFGEMEAASLSGSQRLTRAKLSAIMKRKQLAHALPGYVRPGYHSSAQISDFKEAFERCKDEVRKCYDADDETDPWHELECFNEFDNCEGNARLILNTRKLDSTLSHTNAKKTLVKLEAMNHLSKKQLGSGKLKQCGDDHDKCMSDAGLDYADPDILEWSEDQWAAAGACAEGFAKCLAGDNLEKAEVCGTEHEACFNAAGLEYGDDAAEWDDDDFDAAESCGHDYLACLAGPDNESRKVKLEAMSHLSKRRRGGADKTSLLNVKKHLGSFLTVQKRLRGRFG